MWCTKCGKELDDNAKFCVYCGEKIEQPVTDKQPDNKQKNIPMQKGHPIPAWLVAVIAGTAVIVIVGVTVVLLGKKDDSIEVADTTERRTTAATTEKMTTEEVTEEITEEPVEEWRQLYADLIRRESQDYQRVYTDSGSDYDDERYIHQYVLAYIDADDIPELIIQYFYPNMAKFETMVYYCQDGNVFSLYDSGWMYGVEYVERTGKLLIIDMSSYTERTYTFYTLESGQYDIQLLVTMYDDDGWFADRPEGASSILIGEEEVTVDEYRQTMQEMKFDAYHVPDLIAVTEENVSRSLGIKQSADTRQAETAGEDDFDALLKDYLTAYIEMVNRKDYNQLKPYIRSGKDVTEGYSVESQMKNQAGNNKVVRQSLVDCFVDEVIWIDDTTCQIRTSETYDAVYKKSIKEIKAETNSNTWELVSKYAGEDADDNLVYEISEFVYQQSFYELKRNKRGEWKFYRFIEPVKQTQDAYRVDE